MITSHIAVFGGCAVLLALGFDPFIQNLIDYKSSLVEDSFQVSLLANSSVYDKVGQLQDEFQVELYMWTDMDRLLY